MDTSQSLSRPGRRIALGLLALVIVLAGVRLALPTRSGLNAEYFDDRASTTTPAVTAIDDELSTTRIAQRWPDLSPDTFHVRWFGYLGVDDPGTYTFDVTADDGGVLRVDNAVVVDTGSGRGTFSASGQVLLDAGPHAIAIDVREDGGDYTFEWGWRRGQDAGAPVPSWRLAPTRRAWQAQRVARVIDRVNLALLVGLVGWCIRVWRPPIVALVRAHAVLALLALFVVMAVAQTWPLALDPAHLSRNDNADTVLNEWALAWVNHQVLVAPGHLFDANIFHPERYTLAYSESMIVQATLGAPLYWLGASPVLAYNLLLIAGFALNGWVMALVIRRWTGDTTAGAISGTLFAFNAHILTRLPHMQALHVEFLPLALWCWDALLRSRRVRVAMLLGVMVALQALTSVYLAVFTFVALAAVVLARAPEWVRTHTARVGALLALGAVVALALATPFLLPYLWVHQLQGFDRTSEDALGQAASLASYLSTPSRFHYPLWSARFFGTSSALFPGVTAVLLSLCTMRRGTAWRDGRCRMCLAMGACGLLISFGPRLPGYELLCTVVPVVRIVRVVSSFGYLLIVALAMAAGFGVVELRRAVAVRWWPVTASALLLLAFVEPLAAPLELSPYAPPSRLYDRLRGAPGAVVLELPFFTTSAGFAQARYMLNSTHHWQPMLNGYSGFRPASYYQTADALATFPSPSSIAWLQQRGVTHVFVHVDSYDDEQRARIAAAQPLHEIARDRGIILYGVERGGQ